MQITFTLAMGKHRPVELRIDGNKAERELLAEVADMVNRAARRANLNAVASVESRD